MLDRAPRRVDGRAHAIRKRSSIDQLPFGWHAAREAAHSAAWHTFSLRSPRPAHGRRIPPGVLLAGRFVVHFVEMWIAMLVGMQIFMGIPGVMALPSLLHQTGMALSMSVPMVVWMRVRGHGWRHGIDMAVAMVVPWGIVEGLVALGAAEALPWLPESGTAAMAMGMLGFMLFHREHYAGGAHHQHAAAHSESSPHGRIP